MPAERFDIIFSGELLEGQEPEKVRRRVGRMLKASDAQLERLFSGKPAVIKKGADIDTAGKYRLAFRQAGALIMIRPSAASAQGQQAAVAAPQKKQTAVSASPNQQNVAAQPPPPAMTLAPPNTGSLEGFAPKFEPAPLPDISAMDIDSPGVVLDETPAPPPARIDTGDLDVVQEQEWTLEDCSPPPAAPLQVDIDDLDFAALDDTSHIPPEPPPQPLPNIDALDLAAQDDTSHIPPEPPPAPLPDTSGMTLEKVEEETPKYAWEE